MKGIILAGGAGNRLYPLTKIMTKQLQPIYDKPMIYYPLSTLMLTGIKDILIITTQQDQPHFRDLLGSGEHLGLNLQYVVQKEPKGLAEAFILGEDFIKGDDVCLILGDNLFYGDFKNFREASINQKEKANNLRGRVFAYKVMDPERFGVVEFDESSLQVKSIEEKPEKPKSHYAIPGMYFFDSTVSERAKNVKPSSRGELEITSVMQSYLDEEILGVEILGRGIAWLDTGTPQALMEAGEFICAIEKRQGFKVGCIEEISLRMGYINKGQFEDLVENLPNCDYKNYLQVIKEEL